MKKLFKQTHRKRPGISLVEVIIVLGISSLMIGGAFAWFDTQKTSDFYNDVRQLESRIREVQSENTSSVVPGFTKDSVGSGCNSSARSGCVIGEGEEVFGTAVAMAVPNAGDTFSRLKILYLKKGKESSIPPLQSSNVSSYGTVRQIDLPASVRFEGFKVFGDGICANPAAYRSLRYETGPPGTDFTSPTQESMIVFRRTTGGYNAFWPNNPTDFTNSTVNASKPVWVDESTQSNLPGWLGSYDDATFQYLPAPTGSAVNARLKSQPCAVLWRFGSTERSATDPDKPRFTAEINFNLVDGSTTLVTR